MRGKVMVLGAALLMSACASMAQQDTPALAVDPTIEGQAELVRVVSSALKTSDVTISADALTRESLLVIERKPARDATGQRLTGRDFGRPEQFQLVKHGSKCVLIHVGTGMRYELNKVQCAPK